MLSIKNLVVSLKNEDKKILDGLSLEIKDGEIHAIMGPNGTGKSTLSKTMKELKQGYFWQCKIQQWLMA